MSDDERKLTDRLRGVEMDALLRSDPPADGPPDGAVEPVNPGDATAQIRPADLARLAEVAAGKSLSRTERVEAVGERNAPITEAMPYVRPTQQSGHLRAVLDQDLREVPVEPMVQDGKFNATSHHQSAVEEAASQSLRDSAELVKASESAGPSTDKIELEDAMNTIPLPTLHVSQREPQTQPFSQIKPTTADADIEASAPASTRSQRMGVLVALAAAGLIVAALIVGFVVSAASP